MPKQLMPKKGQPETNSLVVRAFASGRARVLFACFNALAPGRASAHGRALAPGHTLITFQSYSFTCHIVHVRLWLHVGLCVVAVLWKV